VLQEEADNGVREERGVDLLQVLLLILRQADTTSLRRVVIVDVHLDLRKEGFDLRLQLGEGAV
jgi:hypothetical protein